MSDNVDYRHHDNKPHAMAPDQQCSILISKALDCLGYNQDLIKYRVAYWKMNDVIANNKRGPHRLVHQFTAGSQAEGVVGYFGSDTDTMLGYRDTICTDTPFSVIGNRNIFIFQTVNHDTAPGYTQLKLYQLAHDGIATIQDSLLLSECGDSYLSSDLFTKALMVGYNEQNRKLTSKTLTKAGPAVPMFSPVTPDIVHDVVFSFKCHCPVLLRSWLTRPRRYNWPPRNILYDISQMHAHVVPVGCKGSDAYNQEWRICFTKAEIHLIHCLNDTQIKLYIVLKMISKQLLKILCSEITSYIIKNIVLWMCESFSNDLFTDKQLGSMIIQAFVFLKRCVTKNYLPSYMIPERNLFNGRIKPEQKLRLIAMLSSLIEEEPLASFKRIDKMRDALLCVHRAPAMADYNRIKRDLVENLYLLLSVRASTLSLPGMSSDEQDQLCRGDELGVIFIIAINNIVLPEWRTLSLRGVDVSRIVDDTLKTLIT